MTRRVDGGADRGPRRSRWTVLLAVLLALATTGCTARHAAPASSAHRLRSGGRDRSYLLHVPAGLPTGRPVPLVVMLHGGFGSAGQAEQAYGWDAEADRHAFAVAYPDGVDHAWAVGGGCCGQPAAQGVDDVAFVSAVVADVGHRLAVDPRRVYATGISNGGMMAYRLACDTRLFAAVGPDSATLLGPCPTPAPVSVLHIHGTADQNVPYRGGPGNGFARIDGPAVPAVVDRWRAVDRCAAPTSSTEGPVTRLAGSCPQGRAVELVTVDGAGHQWPGGAPRTAAERLLGLDPPSTALDATGEFWSFFAAHPAPQAP
ncbi:alpha/beta hydrolase family esterase [Kitasatospora sp. NPDC058965]|uniref:extracellular catalytic domain type 1 short-chain-length polyhydroxyalkanoate depolymerase n=1 Tax=Kitasatospora sp. NPDC058965 TaxID=3346682 RepID=UPI003696B154